MQRSGKTNMEEILLGIGEIGVSVDGRPIRTQGLGCCVAVSLWCPAKRVAGLVQIVLPEARINPGKGKEKPGYFADTGIPALTAEMQDQGCAVLNSETQVKIVGGAQVMNSNDAFNIGAHNISAVKSILRDRGFRIVAEEVGGHESKTVAVFPRTGDVMLTSPGQGEWYI